MLQKVLKANEEKILKETKINKLSEYLRRLRDSTELNCILYSPMEWFFSLLVFYWPFTSEVVQTDVTY